jgi:hypothetical protein
MKRKQALEIQKSWGDAPCTHPAFAREYDLGVRTGNYICTQCGRTFTWRERKEAEGKA